MNNVFEVLAEPNRRRIVELLRDGELAVNEIVEALGLSQPSVSKHLRVLREAGVVGTHPDAQRRLYFLRPEPMMELDAWLAPYRLLWEQRLDRLEELLKEMQPTELPDSATQSEIRPHPQTDARGNI